MFRKKKNKFNALALKRKMREGYIKILNDKDIKLQLSESF